MNSNGGVNAKKDDGVRKLEIRQRKNAVAIMKIYNPVMFSVYARDTWFKN